jgi:hypothetical protein
MKTKFWLTKFGLRIAAALLALTAFSYAQAGTDVKKAADDTGKATDTAAKKTAHATKTGAKATGKGVAKGTKAVGKGVKKGAEKTADTAK